MIRERGGALRLPDPEHVRVLIDDSIAHDYARAEVSLDHRGFESLNQAAKTAESAARFFDETGEPALAQHYRALEERFRCHRGDENQPLMRESNSAISSRC